MKETDGKEELGCYEFEISMQKIIEQSVIVLLIMPTNKSSLLCCILHQTFKTGTVKNNIFNSHSISTSPCV
jgi:hypothetical protein